MSTLTAQELVYLRDKHPHFGKFYLSFLNPAVVYCGTISGTPAKGDRSLTVVNVSGDISKCVAGNTVLIGTSPGDYSISRRRYRSRVGNVITIDENSVTWAAGQYVTVLDDHMVYPIYPYITDDAPFVFYKDRDVVYSNQNTNIPPVAIAGDVKVGFLKFGSIVFDLDGTESYAMKSGATIVSYLWECTEGTIAAPTSAITTLTMTTATQCWLKLTVTDSSGTSQSTYRRVYVHDRTGVNSPHMDFEIIGNPVGSYSSGGWEMRVRLYADAELSSIPDNTQVVLWYESFYDGEEVYIGDNRNIRFVGYITSEIVSSTFGQSGYVEFNVSTVNKVLDTCNMFSISLEEYDTVDTWYRFPRNTLTVARAIHHLWRWHSTLFDVCDVLLPTENTSTMYACDDMANGTLMTITSWAYTNGIFAKGCCTKTGRLIFKEDILMLPTARQNALPEVIDITLQDCRGDVISQYTRNSDWTTSAVTASGYAMLAGIPTPLVSKAPGDSPENKGQDTYTVERLCISDQAELNVLCGRLFAKLNTEIQELRLSLSGNYPVDVAAQEWYVTSMAVDKRGNTITNAKLTCISVTDVINMIAGTVYPECIFELKFTSEDGVTYIYPVIEPPLSPSAPYTVSPYTPTPAYTLPTAMNMFGVSARIGNGSSVLTTGEYAIFSEVPFNCIIDQVVLFSGDVGSVEIDIRKTTYALSPPTGANSIVGLTPPTLTSSQKSVDAVLSGWTRVLYKGDILSYCVNSVSVIRSLLVSLTGRRF